MLNQFLDPKNDVAFKKIFGTEKHKGILIHFLNDILEFSGENELEDVEFLSTIQDAEIASKKQSVVDVLCRDKTGVQYIVEMQVAPFTGFEKRAQYYAAKAYCRQADKGSVGMGRYENLKEIIFIAIMDTIVFPGKAAYKSDHVILDKESFEHDLKDFYFTFIELPKFKKTCVEDLTTMIEKWCYFFKHGSDTTAMDFKKISADDEVIEQAYEALCSFNWTEKELIAYEQEVKRLWDEKAVWNTAIDSAKTAGVTEGIEKGKLEGKLENQLNVVRKCLALNYDIETISSITDLSAEEIKKIKNTTVQENN